ncbi:MAG: membrane protein insertase YidC [Gammaproteobacteria bacterium RIFCSPHIGHO2_12_FULL_63_22]|nr:MAG: membrane protein insertase YidC [Gammaproteobacteria bacterium RIFCSPHIGHO2_12_FULL_63_22]
MNQTRSFLLIAWLVVATLLWMEWSKGQLAATTAPAIPAAATSASTSPEAAAPVAGLAPPPAAGSTALPPAGVALAPAAGTSSAAQSARPITIANDTLRLTIDLNGGRITDSQLLKYTLEKKAGSPNVHLLDSSPATYQVAESGLIRVDTSAAQQTLDAQFSADDGASQYVLAPGAASLSVPLSWTDPGTGLVVKRTLTLKRGSYVLEVNDRISNPGAAAQRIYPFVRLSRVAPPPPPKHSFLTSPETFSFVGAAWYTPDGKYEKTPLSDYSNETPPAGTITGGWIAMLQHHFATAWVPQAKEPQVQFNTTVETRNGVPLYVVRSIASPLDVAPGSSAVHDSRLWVGPKLQAPMAEMAPNLDLTVDYGMLSFIAKPLFMLLSWLHGLFGNWGWAIIAIVVLLKAALYPLSAKQYQSMAKMRAVQPRIEALKERYGDDKQQFQIAMMELYKKEKINPIGGCLPMLIPIPIFLGLYWVLLETVELRHAAWMGWIQNLTAADPYFVLPAINLTVMYLTQKLTPMPGIDPLQKKMMQFMPLVFGVMMAFFPAGLVLYWVTNGLLGLLQQWWMTKQHGPKTPVVAK